jgi:hypothetical protein
MGESAALAEKKIQTLSIDLHPKLGYACEKHPYKQWIKRLVESGVAPLKIAAIVKERYPDKPLSEKTIYNWIHNYYPQFELLPAPYYKAKMSQFDTQVDALEQLYALRDDITEQVGRFSSLEEQAGTPLPDGMRWRALQMEVNCRILDFELRTGKRKQAALHLEIEQKSVDLVALITQAQSDPKEDPK